MPSKWITPSIKLQKQQKKMTKIKFMNTFTIITQVTIIAQSEWLNISQFFLIKISDWKYSSSKSVF